MLLKQLLQKTSAAHLLFRDPFQKIVPEMLVQEVIGMANLDHVGPRYLVFGVNRAAMEGSGVVGIPEESMILLKSAHRLISALVKPLVQLAFIYDRIDGKLVGALEVDGCEEGPYAVRRDYSSELVGGHSWIREGRGFRDARPEDLEAIRARVERANSWDMSVTFPDHADDDIVELPLPDCSNPPSVVESMKLKETMNWKEAAEKALGTVNTRMIRLMHLQQRGADKEFDDRGMTTLMSARDALEKEMADEDAHYYFEQKGIRLNITVTSNEKEPLQDTVLSVAFPALEGFDIADHICKPPDDDGSYPGNDANYPKVRKMKQGVIVTATLGTVAPGASVLAFAEPLRLSADPQLSKRKVGIKYSLKAGNKVSTHRGVLKLRFGDVIEDIPQQPTIEEQALPEISLESLEPRETPEVQAAIDALTVTQDAHAQTDHGVVSTVVLDEEVADAAERELLAAHYARAANDSPPGSPGSADDASNEADKPDPKESSNSG